MNNSKGYGFRPSEEELIGYLRDRTFRGRDFLVQDITDLGADICNWAPWDLPGCTTVTSSDPVWYLIYPITYKHPKKKPKMIDMATNKGPDGKRMPINRVTNYGNWKESGTRLKVKASDSKKEIAEKTRLYFDPSRAKNEKNKKSKAKDQKKSLWVLYQYELIDVDPNESKYFLGKLMMRQSEPTNISNHKGETSQQLPSDYIENEHFPTPENLQVDYTELITNPEVPNIGIGAQSQLYTNHQDHSFQSVLIDNDETFLENLFVSGDLYWDGICLHELGVPEAPDNNGDGVQNQSSINQQVADEFRNSNLIDNEIANPDERSKSTAAKIDMPNSLGMTESSNLMELISNPEVPNIGIEAQNQLYTNQQDHSLQSVIIDNDETYLEERSNQHNIVARKEGFNLPCNFNNYHIADISQMELFEFDDLYGDGIWFHELCGVPQAPNNNGDGIQNQSSINQQVADEFRNSNLIDNEIVYPDERSKSAAAEIEGSDLPSLGMTESSYLMEAFRKKI